jgi:large subunit ribosomal protein L4
MKVSVYNQKAEIIGQTDLNPKIFEVKPSMHLLAEAVRISRSNSRQGTSNTKTRGEVRGGGKKPWKQKGTGRARVGSTRSPIWRHGGITFGPRSNQNWELKLNKKAKTAALFMALSDKAKGSQFIIIDQIVLDQPKTKEFARVLSDLRLKISASAEAAADKKDLGKNVMFLMPKKDDKLARASRNIPSVFPTLANSLNVVDVMKADSILALKDSLPVIEKTYLKK